MTGSVSRRRFLKLAGAGALGALLAACAPAKAPEPTQAPAGNQTVAAPAGSKKIVFSSYTWSGSEAAMRSILDVFMKQNANIQVEGQFVPSDYDAKVQTQIAAGTPPDVGIASYGNTVTYAKSGVLLSLSEYVSRDSFPIDKMQAAGVAQYRWNKGDFDTGAEGGDLWGLPSDAQGLIFAYNKKMFDDAGVKYPTDDWTWDDFVSAGKAITKADQNKWGCMSPDVGLISTRPWPVWSAGGEMHTADFTKSSLDQPEAIEGLKWMWDLIYTYKISPQPGAAAQTGPFQSGQVAMNIDGVWAIADYSNIKDFDWDIALLPKHPKTGKRTTDLESDGWWIYKDSKDHESAWTLLKFLSDAGGEKLFADANYVIPPNMPDVAKDWYAQKPPEHRSKALDNLVQDARKVDACYYENGTIVSAFLPVLQKAFADGTDIEAACKDAAKVMTDELTKARTKFSQ